MDPEIVERIIDKRDPKFKDLPDSLEGEILIEKKRKRVIIKLEKITAIKMPKTRWEESVSRANTKSASDILNNCKMVSFNARYFTFLSA